MGVGNRSFDLGVLCEGPKSPSHFGLDGPMRRGLDEIRQAADPSIVDHHALVGPVGAGNLHHGAL